MSLESPTPVVGYDQHRSASSTERRTNLPRIEHPSKRFDEEQRNSLDIRGRSREGYGDGQLIRKEYSTSRRTKHRNSSSTRSNEKLSKTFHQLEEIPEDTDTVYGQDREKVRLPIFGKTH